MIEVKYRNRLGNQLFQYCFGRILAEKLGYKLKAKPISGFPNTKTDVDGHDYSNYPPVVFRGHIVDLKSILKDRKKRRVILDGHFQRYEYYKSYKQAIRNNWLLTDIKIDDSINKDDIIIHIRRSDKLWKLSGDMLPFSFYEKALRMTKYNRVFICTEDPNDPFFKKFKRFNPIIRSKSELEDLKFIMSFNKIIISQSTFSWWSAFLSNAEEIYFPLPSKGCWSEERPDIDLIVDDEDRYTFIKFKDVYKRTIKEQIRYLIFKQRFKKGPSRILRRRRGISVAKQKVKIVQYGFPASGSTIIWQILQYIFSNVKKTHAYIKYDKNLKVVATVRDFRDCLCTALIRKRKPIRKDSIISEVDYFKISRYHFISLDKNRKEWQNKENILWLRYEDFINNFDYIFNQLETFFKIKMTDQQKRYITYKFSIEANKEISDKIERFDTHQNHIHGDHITHNGQIGKWKHIIPKDLHKLVNELLYEDLKRWGYIEDMPVHLIKQGMDSSNLLPKIPYATKK